MKHVGGQIRTLLFHNLTSSQFLFFLWGWHHSLSAVAAWKDPLATVEESYND